MTLNDLIRKANEMARQLSSGDVPLDKDIDFTLATDNKGGYGIIVNVNKQ